jgi:MFS family permease
MSSVEQPKSTANEFESRRVGLPLDLHGICNSTMVQLSGGVFLTGYLLALGSGDIIIGIAAALPLAVKLFQLYTSWRIERKGHWWQTCIRGALLGRVPLLLAAALPFLGLDPGSAAWALIAIIALSALGGSIWEIAFLTWMAELVPARIRGNFWGKRTRVSEFTGLSIAVAASIIFDQWRNAHPGSLDGYAVVFAIAAIAGLVGILFLRKIPVPEQEHHKQPPVSLWATLLRPARDNNFRSLLTFVGSWGFAVGLIGPFTAVYMLEELKLSFVAVTVISSLPTAIIALTQAYWGRLADHFGSRPVLRAASYIITAACFLWLLSGPGLVWPLVLLQIISGAGWSAYHISMNNMVLKLAPSGSRSSYVASIGALFAASQGVAPIAGGILLAVLKGTGMASLDTYYILFGVSAALRTMVTPLLGRVTEPGGTQVGHMIRVLGRFRSMGAAPGTELLFDYTYTHMARIADFITRERKGNTGHRPEN